MTGALQGGILIRNPQFDTDKRSSQLVQSNGSALSCKKLLRQGFQPLLFSDGRLGAPLRLKGQVQIFQLRLLPTGNNPRLQLRRQLALFINGFKNRPAPYVKFLMIGQPLFYQANLHLIEFAGRLFAVAGDEGDRGPLFKQGNSLFD